jgi:hypothetical protein
VTVRRWLIRLGLDAAAATLLLSAAIAAQTADPGPVYRVFLRDGRALPTYGESAVIGDRVVFTLMVGDGSVSTQYQLISLPAGSVDVDRTARYAMSVRAARYAATRGETDYADMTAEVSRSLQELAKVEDPKRRLSMAEEAKRRLLAWSRENYGYRAADVEELAGLFDEVIAQLRASAGLSQFNVDLMAGRGPTPSEPMLPKPTLAQAVELALAAAQAADVETDRAAIMTAMKAATRDAPVPDAVRADLERRVAEEKLIDQTYEALASKMRDRMDTAMRRADVRAMTAVREDLITRDRQLGGKRPGVVDALLREIDEKLQRAQAHRAALAQYMAIRPRLLEYEQAVRPVLSVLDGASPSLTAMREMTGPGIYWLQ